ncbi:MAG: glycosyltransferase [Flavobacterium sp.]|nr:glycosyltransferase [Flavobacterium sp.]
MINVIIFLILAIYSIFILQLIYGFSKIKSFQPTNLNPKTTFSILVPFRNEAKNLPILLKSIAKLNYPKELFELIMIDDFSKDNSESIYTKWRMQNGLIETTLLENLRLSNSPKKDAISKAIPIVKNQWIITTDADCIVKKNWLLTLDNFIQNKNPEMVVGAVIYKIKNNWFHWFQQLDLMSLQGTTLGSFGIGKPFMCNGANFAYTKKLFLELDGFNGNDTIASGDDVFLLQKAVAKMPEKVHYLKHKDVIVKTKPENDLYQLFMQRARWASKTTSYQNTYAKFLAVFVLLMNLGLVISIGLSISGYLKLKIFLLFFIIKYVLDYILLYKSNAYLRNKKFFLPVASSVIYPFFSSLVGLFSMFGSFSWKERHFSKQ